MTKKTKKTSKTTKTNPFEGLQGMSQLVDLSVLLGKLGFACEAVASDLIVFGGYLGEQGRRIELQYSLTERHLYQTLYEDELSDPPIIEDMTYYTIEGFCKLREIKVDWV